ncbi:hypothetical protein Rs2_16150 [Raphanus sativus]|nr:hypothetical protein Rs2_16150 [Raphanus sativus]
MALASTNVDLADITGEVSSINTVFDDENQSIQRVMITIQLDRKNTSLSLCESKLDHAIMEKIKVYSSCDNPSRGTPAHGPQVHSAAAHRHQPLYYEISLSP